MKVGVIVVVVLYEILTIGIVSWLIQRKKMDGHEDGRICTGRQKPWNLGGRNNDVSDFTWLRSSDRYLGRMPVIGGDSDLACNGKWVCDGTWRSNHILLGAPDEDYYDRERLRQSCMVKSLLCSLRR